MKRTFAVLPLPEVAARAAKLPAATGALLCVTLPVPEMSLNVCHEPGAFSNGSKMDEGIAVVAVGVTVAVGVKVEVNVEVEDAVAVGVIDGVNVGVRVLVEVWVKVCVGVRDGVRVAVLVQVGVRV